MSFEECVRRKLVKKMVKNRETSNSLIKLAEISAENLLKINNPTLRTEAYYEILKELMTALLSLEGYKSYSHECLISFVKNKFSNKFSLMQIELIDQLRILRNDIVYRGDFVKKDFLERNEGDIQNIIKILKEILEKEKS